jgi:hypothetical protein
MTRVVAKRWLALALRAVLAVGAMGLAAVHAVPALAGPPPVDPKAMSGLPRADPALAAGTVTVRVLDGGFDAPATNADVTLDVTAADGSTTQRTAQTDAQGRATFEGLAPGGTAVAKVVRGAETLESQPIELLTQAGSRVMLVAGASKPAAAGAPRHGEPGGPEVPAPGTAFVLDGTPAGELVVGTFDLDARKPIGGVEVTLRIELPTGEVSTRKATSDERGKVAFDGLIPPATPAEAKLSVSATLGPGGPAKESSPFAMNPSVGMAVVLAKGEFQQPSAQAPAAPQVEGPRTDPSLPQGTVRVQVLTPATGAVGEQRVRVVKKDQTGTDVAYDGITDARGLADVKVEVQSDAVYLVEVVYDGGPYSSPLFQVDKRGGIAVDMLVYPVTNDVSRIRSVVQFDIDGLENDLARVIQLQDVAVSGDEAFWPRGRLKILPAEGATSLQVLPMSQQWLAHGEKAPFVELARPIPPGEVARLAIGYVVEHDGDVEIEFKTPFDLIETSVMVGASQTLEATGATRRDGESPIPTKTLWVMGARAPEVPLSFGIGGLPVRTPIYRRVAMYGGIAIALALGFAVVTRVRSNRRDHLVARRDSLLRTLEGLGPNDERRRAGVVAALDHVWRQLDALEQSKRPGAPPESDTPRGAGA